MVVIEVDTKRDSKEDIRKTIQFLKNFLDSSTDVADVEQGSFNIFDQPAQEPEEDKDFEIKPMFY